VLKPENCEHIQAPAANLSKDQMLCVQGGSRAGVHGLASSYFQADLTDGGFVSPLSLTNRRAARVTLFPGLICLTTIPGKETQTASGG
jgi:hypothetical protein